THWWLQPRYGLIVQPNGSDFAAPGTWLSADLASTSWKVSPANSGVCTERTRLLRRARPGSASSASTPSSCPLHRIQVFEHVFDSLSSGFDERALTGYRELSLDPRSVSRALAEPAEHERQTTRGCHVDTVGRLQMQVGFRGVARVAALRDGCPGLHAVSGLHADAAPTQMHECDARAIGPADDEVIPRDSDDPRPHARRRAQRIRQQRERRATRLVSGLAVMHHEHLPRDGREQHPSESGEALGRLRGDERSQRRRGRAAAVVDSDEIDGVAGAEELRAVARHPTRGAVLHEPPPGARQLHRDRVHLSMLPHAATNESSGPSQRRRSHRSWLATTTAPGYAPSASSNSVASERERWFV